MYLARLSGIGYGNVFTVLYICSCLFFTYSLKNTIKNKTMLTFILIILLFNPISYSSDLFQRLYRNSLSYIELLFFLGVTIKILTSKNNNALNYVFLGFMISIMLLTKEDNIWTIIIIIIIIICKLYKNLKIKNIVMTLIPIIVIVLNLNIVSYLNYKNYNIYTYSELSDSYFKDAYTKILQIKKKKKKDEKIAITKNTLYKLADNSKVFGFSRKEIDNLYTIYVGSNEEILSSNIIWTLRSWIYKKYDFKDGKEANEYFYKLSNEIDELFKEGKLKKRYTFPLVFTNPPTFNSIKQLPKNFIKVIVYTSTYKDIKTFSIEKMLKTFALDNTVGAYSINYYNSHNTCNIIQSNMDGIEVVRITYEILTIVFSIISLIIYMKNIKIKDMTNLILHIILIIYLIIIFEVTYTHITAFDAIRYCYLGNVYILQSIFIFLNISRIYNKKVKVKENDFSNNSSI